MKLRNKQTGEIEEFEDITRVFKFIDNQNTYNSLAEFIDEWEDYEEPNLIPDQIFLKGSRVCIDYKSVEAGRKAVEKLKAWKRLKDKGFRFIEGHLDNNDDFIIKAKLGNVGLIDQPDVSLLFGGKE